jgi:hypothetical protein
MHAIITNKPLPAVQASTVPGPQAVCSSKVYSTRVCSTELRSASGVPPVRSRQLRANSPHPTQLGRHCSSPFAMNLPSLFPASATSSIPAEKEAGFNYDRTAPRMNRAAILPIISLTIRVLHPIHTDKHED